MFSIIKNFLTDEQVRDFNNQLDALDWADGALTAPVAKNRKNNEEITLNNQAAHPVINQALQVVAQHPVVNDWAKTRRPAYLMFSRYGTGMRYDSHYDSAVMKFHQTPSRTDVSFTVYLNDPSEYQGGELVLESPLGEVSIKEPAGTIVLYDTGLRHRVETVVSGTRLVIVGWIESTVRAPEHRQLLRDLSAEISALADRDAHSSGAIALRGIYARLLRFWTET